MFNKKQIILLAAPSILLVTTYLAYSSLAVWLGPVLGYLGGFLFYWIVWCGLLLLWVVGPNGLREMFKDARPRFGRPAWLGLLFLIGPFVTPFFTMFLPRVRDITPTILVYSVLFAITNGTFSARGGFFTTRSTWACSGGKGRWCRANIYPSSNEIYGRPFRELFKILSM